MPHVNMSRPDRDLTPGTFLWTVATSTEKTAKSGSPMFVIELRKDDGTVVRDNIMLGGNGWSIGKPKLSALGFGSDFDGDIEASDIVGRKVWATVAQEEYNGRTRLAVDIRELTHAGYSPESDVPKGCSKPVVDDQDIPF